MSISSMRQAHLAQFAQGITRLIERGAVFLDESVFINDSVNTRPSKSVQRCVAAGPRLLRAGASARVLPARKQACSFDNYWTPNLALTLTF